VAIDSRNSFVYSPLDITTATGSASAGVVLASVAASGTAGVFNVAKRVQISIASSSGSAQVPIQVQLFNGASSTGTVLTTWNLTPSSGSLATPALLVVDMDNLHIAGASNTAMCVSTPVGAASGGLISVNLQTYLFPKSNFKTVTNAA
jgi:hypothetical protein